MQSNCVGETYDDITDVPEDVKDELRYRKKLLFLLLNAYVVTMPTSTAQQNIFLSILLAGGGTVWKYDDFDVSENTAHFGTMPTPKNAIDINSVLP
jgi:hypothetical protein